MIARGCVPFVALLLVAADQPAKDAAKEDRDKLQGEWVMVSVELPPKVRKPDEEQIKRSGLVVKDDTWQMITNGKEASKMPFTIDPTKDPKEIDFKVKIGEGVKVKGGNEFTLKGIYKLDGDTLTLCRTVLGTDDRPKEFKAGEVLLAVYKRKEKK